MISIVFPVMTALSHFFLFCSSLWPTLSAPPAPSSTLKGWHWQVLGRRKHQTHLGKMTGSAGRTTLPMGSGVHTADCLEGRSSFCLCLIFGFKKPCRNWAFLPNLLKLRQFEADKGGRGWSPRNEASSHIPNLGVQTPPVTFICILWDSCIGIRSFFRPQ